MIAAAADLRGRALAGGMSAATVAGMASPALRSIRHLRAPALALALPVALGACGSSDAADVRPTPPASPPTGTGARAVLEADIIQLAGDRLYAMSESGTVSIVDVSDPGDLRLLGQTRLPGRPFEMYRRGPYLITMTNRARDGAGATSYDPATTGGDDAGAAVIALDVRDPGAIRTGASFDIPGEIADSRVVGNVLYVATYENAACFGCGDGPRTLVSSYDLVDPIRLRPIDQLAFASNAPDGYNLPWGQHWKRSIVIGAGRLYVGGHGDIEPSQLGTRAEGIVDVVDIRDPGGRLRRGARLTVAGAILSRWQLDEREGILRVISQLGAGRTGNGLASPVAETFRVVDTDTFTPLGRMEMRLPRQEGLRTVRFDGERAYAITYNQTDPLFVLDLRDPARPRQRGELFMPGFMYHLEPHGDRVIGLGIDRTDPEGSLNVSLFDVADADWPTMLARVGFGPTGITEDYQILNSEISEDQDRIQKSFRVLPDGLVVVPFSGLQPYGASGSCANAGGGVQLVQWARDDLEGRALLPLPGNPRRALDHDGALLALSDSHLRAFSRAELDDARVLSEVVVGECVPRDATGGWNGNWNGGWEGDYQYQACSAGGSSRGAPLAFVLLALAVRRRRRRAR